MPEDTITNGETGPSGNKSKSIISGLGASSQKIIISVIIGVLAIGLILVYSLYKGTKATLIEETQKVESAELRLEEQQRELNDRQSRLVSAQSQIEETGKARDVALGELAEFKTENARLDTQLKASQTTVDDLKKRLSIEESTLAELRAKLDEERQGQKLLFSKIERLMKERTELREKLARLENKSSVEMPQMVVTRGIGNQGGVVGEVLAVNDRYGFVVINLGSGEGIESGTKFKILDHGMVVGNAVARRVLDRMTVADLAIGKTARRIKKNFKAIVYK